MMEWKFRVGDVIKQLPNRRTFKVVARCVFAVDNYSYRLTDEYCELFIENKDSVEKYFELVKPKSLYEQALDLLGLKVEQEFKIINSAKTYKFDESYQLKFRNCGKWYGENFTIHSILNGERVIDKTATKSEAELILDELKVAMDKANEILGRSGW